MGLDIVYGDGQTPLSEEERDGLLLKTVTTHSELNEHEQLNIEQAIEWIISNKPKKEKILSEEFVKKLHQKMLGNVWTWAGEFRKSEKNIGVKWINIAIELKYLFDDTKYWIANKVYLPDEVAIRFKHRLVNIHCFPNGNGKHSRLMADIIIEIIFNKQIFSWHQSNMVKADEVRKAYLKAMKAGDHGNIASLILFARN